MRTARFLLVAALLTLPFAGVLSSRACEFCSAPSLTLSEQLDQADAVALVKWISTEQAEPKDEEKGTPARLAKTKYQVVEVVKNSGEVLKKEGELVLPEYHPGKPGDLAMLFGQQLTSLEWGMPIEVSTASFNYVSKAPGPKEPLTKRLEFYLDYLEFPDDLVANDAYGEFANAPFSEIRKLHDKFPRERIRKWVSNPKTAVTRLGLYGLMLGLCGNEEDAKLMADRITQPTEDFRLGIDGLMAGYLLLKGEEGLKVLEDTKLKAGVKVPFSETYAAMQAVRFAWNYGGTIKKDRLKESMRLLLDRPEVADLVIADLARWKDWAVQDRLMKLYDHKDYDIPSIKRAIVRYLLVCSKDTEDDKEQNPKAEYAKLAKKHLGTLREKDPDTVKQAERFFYIN
jgi:hypothetical protein